MNQAIQFSEREWWDEDTQAVCFIAMVNGFQLTCAIHGKELHRRYSEEQSALALFIDNRWDLEEEATRAIQDQMEDAQGWVWLSSER